MAPVISRSSHSNLVGVRTVDVEFFWKHELSVSSTDPTGHKEECTLQAVILFMTYFVFPPRLMFHSCNYATFIYCCPQSPWTTYKFSDTSANEDNSFRNHIR